MKREGIITFYHKEKGYAYISYKDEGSEKFIYTHVSQIISGKLGKSRKVLFDIGHNSYGDIATNVEVLYAKDKAHGRTEGT